MSQVYQALEKAEREREKESKKDSFSVIIPEELKEQIQKEEEPTGNLSADKRLVSFFEPASLASEQFRKLRTYLFRLNFSEPLRTIMVTSATSGEGKSFVTANLGVGIAHDLHAHALLVDCDLRNPTLSQWLGVQNGKGLSDYLKGNGTLPGLLKKTGIEKLTVLPAGHVQDNPAELLGSKRMEALVSELKSRYDDRLIIFDATPLLATTEPEVLSKLADGIILVVRAGMTPRETAKQAIASLDRGKVIGVVLNDLAFKSGGLYSRYFGADGYYYHYGYGKKKPESEPRWKELFHQGLNRLKTLSKKVKT